MKILLVEDDPITHIPLQLFLEDLGHAVALATDGQMAADLLLQNGVLDRTFNAIISDCNMPPRKSGIWLLQYLNESRVELPFLLHSHNATHKEAGRDLDLSTVVEYFDFAEFHLKDSGYGYIEEFLSGVR